jgi:hypothetical protein
MATPTYIPLATITLGSADSSIVFSSIPATYRDLVLVQNSKMTSGTSLYSSLTLNGDSGSNYSSINMVGLGSGTPTSGTGAGQPASYPNFGQLESTSEFMLAVLQFFDFSATDKHKSMLFRANLASQNVNAIASRWANTAAITSITITANGSTFAIGSTFSLYGIH